MIQKGDELINGVNRVNYQYPSGTNNFNYNNNNVQINGFIMDNSNNNNNGNLTQAMSFEEYVPLESTLPPVETVLPHYVPTPPPSLPSPSVNITNVNTTVPQFQFQLQHQTPSAPSSLSQLQHDHQNINNHQSIQQQQIHQYNQQHQQVQPFDLNRIESTMNSQLFVEHNVDNNMQREELNQSTVDTSPNSSHNHSILSQETVLNVSDTSTVEAEEGENLSEEQFTYLQNLNSDNLMKFSQQSALQQLIQEQVDRKPNLNLLPTCEEHDYGGYNFRIQINCADKLSQRPGVVYSKETQRLYLKTNENVYIDCFYTEKLPIQPLKIRIFAVFEKDSSDPVLRCQNHISTDNDPNEIVRKSLVRCKNPDAVYYGCDTGKSINERYSVVVPLNSTIKGNETNQLKQQLIVSFTCYNSCMNRKPTAVIFLLEGINGEILAQRTLSVKISTCPKRDRRLYENPEVSSNKRKHLEEPGSTDAKMAKYDNTSIKDEYSRSSFDEISDDGNIVSNTFAGNVHHEKETGDFVLTLKYKTRQHLLQAIKAIYADTVADEELCRSSINARRTRDSELLKKLYHNAYNIKYP